MSLLQIAEPNQSASPHQHRFALGIDLGTTRSMVAVVRSGKASIINADSLADFNASFDTDRQGVDLVIPNNTDNTYHDDTLLPSIVYYGKSSHLLTSIHATEDYGKNNDVINKAVPIVGHQALTKLYDDPKNTIVSAKRFMGRSIADIKFTHPYTLKGEGNDMPVFVTDQGDKSPVEVCAEILRTLILRAQKALPHNSIEGAVITVPAYFDEAQRQATKDAAKVARINVLRLINEPTAAAIAYGLDTASTLTPETAINQSNISKATNAGLFLIYDLGGGTFDVSVLKMSEGVFEVLATGGNSALGGDDIDRLIMSWFIKQAKIDIKAVSMADKTRLALSAKNTKHMLSVQDVVDVNIAIHNINWTGQLSKTQLTHIIEPVTRRTLSVCAQVLRDAHIKKSDLNEVILVGGSTRMPIIKQAVTNFFAKEPLSHLNPDQVVALGAAQMANQLINKDKSDNILLLDVTPLSLGLETMGGLVEVLIPRNTPIPVSKGQVFTTYQDGQTGMVVHVVQGERETVEHCRSLGRFELFGIPAMKAGLARIEVTFDIDANGQLSVSAEETTTHTKSSIKIKPAYGLSDEQQAQLLHSGFEHAEEDKLARKLIETKIEAKRELLALHSALTDYNHLLTDSETQALIDAMDKLNAELEDADKEVEIEFYNLKLERISQAQTILKPLSDDFASRIMNLSIRKSLKGTSADDWD